MVTSRRHRRSARLALGLALAALAALTLAASAGAHAVLEESSPQRGAALERSPGEVTFRFNEPVEASFGAVRVFDSSGGEVQRSETGPSADGREIGATLPGTLPAGYYTAIYRVVSADSHPVSGGITFSVDPSGRGLAGAGGGKTISELLSSSEAGEVTRVGFWVDRWIGFLALALAVGAAAWLVLVWRPSRRGIGAEAETGADRAGAGVGSRARALLLAAIAVGIGASLAAIPFQGAVATGKSFWSAFGGGVPGDVISTRFGAMMLIRAAAFAALLPLALLAGRIARERRLAGGAALAVGLAAAGAVGLALTPGLAGHASTQGPTWLLMPSDAVHVGAMALWSGGLAAMLWLLPAATGRVPAESRTALLLAAMRGFSTLALAAVAAIAVTGAIQGVVEVGRLGALVDTAFGRAVAIKIVLFGALIVLGALNRNRVIPALAARLDGGATPGGPGIAARRNLRLETVLVTVVLAVTAALVSYPPPDSIGAGPVSGSLRSDGTRIEYTVDPGRVGSNEAHVYLFDDRTGAPVEVRSLELAFDPPGEGETPIEADVRKAGPGHYVAPAVALAIEGEWTATVAIRLSRFEERVEAFEVEIR